MAEQDEGCKASDPDGGDPVQRSMDELIASLREQTQKAEQLQEALASRDLISQAKGILMGRLKISADEAFALSKAGREFPPGFAHCLGGSATTGALHLPRYAC